MALFSLKYRRFPFAGLLLAAISGILFEELTSCRSPCLLGSILICGLTFFYSSSLKSRDVAASRWKQGTFFLFIACCFALLHAWQWQESPATRVATILNSHIDDSAVEGIVASEVKLSKTSRASFFLNVKKISLHEKEMTLDIPMLVHWEGEIPAYGDLLSFRARTRAPEHPRNPGEFDYAAWLALQGVFTELTIDPSNPGKIISSNHGSSLMRWALVFRHKAEKLLQLGIDEDPRVCDIIKGITLGKKEETSQDPNDDFRLTGTLHLFVISGLHVGMVAMMIWFFLKLLRLPRRLAVATTIPLLFFYVLATGLHIGSLRAAIMTSIVLAGFLFNRRPQIFNSLAAAAFLLLLQETNLLFSIGWQFSFSVVLAILLLAEPLQRWMNQHERPDPFLPKKLVSSFQHFCYEAFHHFTELIAVSTAAWIGTLIPCLIYFHYISFSAIGANLLAVPLAFLILAVALMTLFTGFFSATLATILNNANWLFAKALLILVHLFAILPASSLYLAKQPMQPVLTIFDLPHAQANVLQNQGKTWLIDSGRTNNVAKTILPFLESSGVNEITGLLVTEKNVAHLGGASVLEALYPTFKIWLPAGETHSRSLNKLLEQIEPSSAKIQTARIGDKITFSSTCYAEVLYAPTEMTSSDISNFVNEDLLVLKLHLGGKTLLIMPQASQSLEAWLLQYVEPSMLKSDLLEMPLENLLRSPLGATFLSAVAPQSLIVPSDPHNALLRQEAKSLLDQQGITLFCQEETGALLVEATGAGVKLKPFLKSKE